MILEGEKCYKIRGCNEKQQEGWMGVGKEVDGHGWFGRGQYLNKLFPRGMS